MNSNQEQRNNDILTRASYGDETLALLLTIQEQAEGELVRARHEFPDDHDVVIDYKHVASAVKDAISSREGKLGIDPISLPQNVPIGPVEQRTLENK